MSNPLTDNLSAMGYRDLQAKAKDLGLNASGSREELEERIAETANSTTEEPSAEPQTNAETPEATQPVEPSMDGAQLHRATALKQKDYNDKQPKVGVFIPFNDGENPELAKQIPFIVNINGWRMEVPRGVMTEVPANVYDIIKERLESEGKMGTEHRIDSDSRKMDALG